MSDRRAADSTVLRVPDSGGMPPIRRGVVAIAAGVFVAFWLLAGLPSLGFLEADACTHYLYGRFAFNEPARFADVWGRPVCTALLSIPAALLGRTGTKLTCLTVAIGVAWTAMAIARRLRLRQPELAFIATLAQPLVFLHSFTEMTELPFALLLGLAGVFWMDRRWTLAAIAVGLMPLARPEGFGVLPIAILLLLAGRHWVAAGVAIVPLVGWNHLGWELWGRPTPWWRWLPDNWPYAGQSLYPAGPWWWFLGGLPVIAAPFLLPAMLAGTAIGLRRLFESGRIEDASAVADPTALGPSVSHRGSLHEGASPSVAWDPAFDDSTASTSPSSPPAGDGDARSGDTAKSVGGWRAWIPNATLTVLAAVVLMPWAFLAGHSLLYAMGRMASNGEFRYLLVVAPFWGVLTAIGLNFAADRLRLSPMPLIAGVLAVLPAATHGIYRVLPIRLTPDWQAIQAVSRWAETDPAAASLTHVMASHPAVYYLMDISTIDPARTHVWSREHLLSPPADTLLIWDTLYGTYNADRGLVVTLQDLKDAGWQSLDEPTALAAQAAGLPRGLAAGLGEPVATPPGAMPVVYVFASPDVAVNRSPRPTPPVSGQ